MVSQNTTKKERDRIAVILYYIYVAFLLVAIGLVFRLVWIQWFWSLDKDVARYFIPNSTKSVIEPQRGSIKACDGRLLAMSTPVYQLYMDCTVRKDYFAGKGEKGAKMESEWQDKARAFAAGLSAEMKDQSPEAYYGQIAKGRREGSRYLKLGRPIDRETLLRLEKLPLMKEGQYRSGVIVTKKDSRQYPYGTLARRTIGYIKDNSNSNGNNHIGLEGKYDYILHGKEGHIWLRPTEQKKRIQNYDSTYVKPEDGRDVVTTLDITIQDIVDRALREQIQEENRIDMACAVLMDVKTGAIRAMVNLVRDTTDGSLNETYNMAVGLNSEPGSVFKATTLMTVLEDGYVKSLDERIPTNGGRFRDYPVDTHVQNMQDISILHGFEISSNYVFRYLAVTNYEDQPQKFLDKLYMYNLGKAFDFDLDGLQQPEFRTPDSPGWSARDLGSIGMGYAVKETPLHILTFYNAIANKGRMMKPYLVERIEKDGRTVEKKGPSVLNASICSKATADTMLRAMKAVTSEGTATRLKKAKVTVAGKTGTSRQVLTAAEIKKYGMSSPYETRDGSYKNLGTFVGFFPADNPKYSAIICVRSGLIRGSLYGGVLPAGAMRTIVDQLYALDPTLGQDPEGEIAKKESVPKAETFRTEGAAELQTLPDLKGKGLDEAVWLLENSGIKCTYTGSGHVAAQQPKAGTKVEKGMTVNLTLK